jgi:hypothetical protein
MDDNATGEVKRDSLVSPCCGSGIKRSFYGEFVCSACRSEIDFDKVVTDSEQ